MMQYQRKPPVICVMVTRIIMICAHYTIWPEAPPHAARYLKENINEITALYHHAELRVVVDKP